MLVGLFNVVKVESVPLNSTLTAVALAPLALTGVVAACRSAGTASLSTARRP